ncbi:hypothetical protein SLA2020_363200 [Shorea laevis]
MRDRSGFTWVDFDIQPPSSLILEPGEQIEDKGHDFQMKEFEGEMGKDDEFVVPNPFARKREDGRNGVSVVGGFAE